MQVRKVEDPEGFLRDAGPLLLADEARHNLVLGIADTLQRHPDVYPEHRLWIVEDQADVLGAALQTPPFNLVLARPERDGVEAALTDTIHHAGIELPGVTAADPEARRFADAWVERTGGSHTLQVGMGVFELTEVREVPRPPGRHRTADGHDRPLLLEWLTDFARDIGPAAAPVMHDPEHLARFVDVRLSEVSDAGLWLWLDEQDRPMSLAGYASPAGSGIRVGPVYSPPEHRGRGYATALVADMSAWLLTQGFRACYLFTDLANPTSNAIYERIGYRRICDALDITFTASQKDHRAD
jgi:uncharacterized protein